MTNEARISHSIFIVAKNELGLIFMLFACLSNAGDVATITSWGQLTIKDSVEFSKCLVNIPASTSSD